MDPLQLKINEALRDIMRFDSNKDNLLTAKEFSDYLDHMNTKLLKPAWPDHKKRKFFEQIDSNRD